MSHCDKFTCFKVNSSSGKTTVLSSGLLFTYTFSNAVWLNKLRLSNLLWLKSKKVIAVDSPKKSFSLVSWFFVAFRVVSDGCFFNAK